MKKIILILLCVSLLAPSIVYSERVATPTDLIEDISEEVFVEELPEEISDEIISIDELYPNHHIEMKIIQSARRLGDEVILGFDLIDYPPGEIIDIEWQYSEDNFNWISIEDANEETYNFIITKENYRYWYRVTVAFHYKKWEF